MKNFKSNWIGLSTSTVSDALDKLGIKGQCFGVKPLKRDFRIIGTAYTIKYIAQVDEECTVGDYIENVPPGSIIVIDNEGRQDVTVWGDILTRYAKIKNIKGTVINGVCRDTNSSLDIDYPIFSKGTYMRTGKDRVQFVNDNIPISFGAISINPGDIIMGDADGVVVVPKDMENEVLEAALSIERSELSIIDSVEKGMSLKEAREKMGYHSLQKKNPRNQ
jgi:4-hydroxy-4-methyl-2-oxoglutarate aldolase